MNSKILYLLNWVQRHISGSFCINYINALKFSFLSKIHIPIIKDQFDWRQLKNGSYMLELRPFTKLGDKDTPVFLALLSFISLRDLVKLYPGHYKFSLYIRGYVNKDGKTNESFNFERYQKSKVTIRRMGFESPNYNTYNLTNSGFFLHFQDLYLRFYTVHEVFALCELRIIATKIDKTK